MSNKNDVVQNILQIVMHGGDNHVLTIRCFTIIEVYSRALYSSNLFQANIALVLHKSTNNDSINKISFLMFMKQKDMHSDPFIHYGQILVSVLGYEYTDFE